MREILEDYMWLSNIEVIRDSINKYNSATKEEKYEILGTLISLIRFLNSQSPSVILHSLLKFENDIQYIKDFAIQEIEKNDYDASILFFLGHILILSSLLYGKIGQKKKTIQSLQELERMFTILEKEVSGFSFNVVVFSHLSKILYSEKDSDGERYIKKTLKEIKHSFSPDPFSILEIISFLEFLDSSNYSIERSEINSILTLIDDVVRQFIQLAEENKDRISILEELISAFGSLTYSMNDNEKASWCFQKKLSYLKDKIDEYTPNSMLSFSSLFSAPRFSFTPGEEKFNPEGFRRKEEKFKKDVKEYLRKQILEDPRCEYIETAIKLAEIYKNSSEYDKALNLLMNEVSKYSETFSIYSAFQPTYARYLELLAELFFIAVQNEEKAISLMEEAIEVRKESKEFCEYYVEIISQDYSFISIVYMSVEKFKECEQSITKFFEEIKEFTQKDRKKIFIQELLCLSMLLVVKEKQKKIGEALDVAKQFVNLYLVAQEERKSLDPNAIKLIKKVRLDTEKLCDSSEYKEKCKELKELMKKIKNENE